MLVNAVMVDCAPWSFPAKDPFREAVPPVFGMVSPTSPALFCMKVTPENVATVSWIEFGLHANVALKAAEPSRPAQAFVALLSVAVRLAPFTWETFDFVVLHPLA